MLTSRGLGISAAKLVSVDRYVEFGPGYKVNLLAEINQIKIF